MLKGLELVLKGFVLGISMVLPGISGGTMAFVMGIYEKLIAEISKLQKQHFKKLFLCLRLKKDEIKNSILFFQKTWDWLFLLPLMFGMGLSIILFIAFAPKLIERYFLPFYSIIFGLILASVFVLLKKLEKRPKIFALLAMSFLAHALLFVLGKDLVSFSDINSPFIFLPVGFLISVALIVPGLSGSYLLLILGLYEKTLLSLKQGDFFVITCFLTGLLFGGFFIAKGINYLFNRYFNETMALILGLILASLYAVYPLPKSSFEELLFFDGSKMVFLFYSVISFGFFMIFHFFYERQKAKV